MRTPTAVEPERRAAPRTRNRTDSAAERGKHMADKHPYVTGPGALVQVVTHFRKSFPGTVDASTLQKLGFAPNNESYVLNVLRFLGLIDQEGKRTTEATKTFNLHEDDDFSKAFAALVSKAYTALFELHGDAAWD